MCIRLPMRSPPPNKPQRFGPRGYSGSSGHQLRRLLPGPLGQLGRSAARTAPAGIHYGQYGTFSETGVKLTYFPVSGRIFPTFFQCLMPPTVAAPPGFSTDSPRSLRVRPGPDAPNMKPLTVNAQQLPAHTSEQRKPAATSRHERRHAGAYARVPRTREPRPKGSGSGSMHHPVPSERPCVCSP